MKTVTNEFKEQITKLGREIDLKFFLHTNDKIITEDSKFLMSEANQHLIVEQFDDTEVDEIIGAEDIYNVSIVNRGNLLSTMMKELDFELKTDLRIGDVIGCKFGLKVNGSYEYVDYGNYMIYSKEFNEDTKTYSYVAYDRMLLTMRMASPEFLSSLEEKTLAYCINIICDTVGLSYTATQQELEDYPNLNKEINEGTFTDLQITYRDILDMICQALGLSMIIEEKQLILKSLNNTIVDEFDETYLKDTNVTFGEKYGPVNSVVLSRSEDNDNIYRRDEESIAENGLCEFKIKDNLIMLYDDREDYIDEIFEQLNGLEYYENDFQSTGITYLDWLDFYNVEIDNKTYKCLMLNDEIKIEQGLEENVYSEIPEETVTDYKTSSKTDKEVSFIVDKQNGKIKSRVTQDEMESAIEQSAEEINITINNINTKANIVAKINDNTSQVQIDADNIDINATDVLNILANNTINLTSKNIAIDSNNFQVTTDGNITATNGSFSGNITSSNANITGGTVNITSNNNNPKLTLTGKAYNNNNSTNYITADGIRINSSSRNLIDIKVISGNSGNIRLESANDDVAVDIEASYIGVGTRNSPKAAMYSNGEIVGTSLYITGSKNRIVTIGDGKKVCLGAYETATPYFGDIGSDKTDSNGYCKIEIENIFSQTIEMDDYKVFIQECGDGKLYVEKYDKYFLVKGTPDLDFDWEMKAIQKGYKNVRLQEKEENK